MPYTRRSKYRQKSYIRVNPHVVISRFNMGDATKKFSHAVHLVARSGIQIRQNALESARMTCNRLLEKTLGKNGYYLELRAYPHHVLRENPLAAGAGADRMSTGMAHPFGKPMGIAAQVHAGQTIMYVAINKKNLELGLKSLKRASTKLPCSYYIQVKELIQNKLLKPAKAQAEAE